MSLSERLDAGFAEAFGGSPELVVRAPGRVNLIGEHTDYNDGLAMPIAISQETQVAFRHGAGEELRIAALDFGESDTVRLSAIDRLPDGAWRNYVRGVLSELAADGFTLPAGEIAIAGSIAKGTGLSSSASLAVATGAAMLTALDRSIDPVALALLAQRAECDFVGMRCGNLDQIASAASRAGHALLIDCRSLALRHIAMPADAAVMIVQSGVERGLVEGEYNRRREQCERAAAVLGVPALREADAAMLAAARERMDETAFARARHVIGDNRRTLEAADALAAGDYLRLGELLREAQLSQKEDFGITVPATERLADLMNRAIGPEGGARQTGGGFGGAVIGLMRQGRVASVREAVLAGYRTPAGEAPSIVIEIAGPGAGLR